MTPTETAYAGVLLASVLISAISQVMLKKAAMKTYPSRFKEYANPLVILAYTLFVGCTLLTILAYQGIPLNLGPVLEATSYIYVTVFGVAIFKERIGKRKVAALALILIGIGVYAFFG